MIRINKPADPPAVLAGRGVQAAQQLRDEFDADPEAYRSGEKKLDIKRAIYAHPTVVEALRSAQHRKCCFCERKSLGDIEHYRPKNGFQQSPTDPLKRPGYYWLAYDWDNLFLACGPCNQRFKRNLFPLENAEGRALSHHDDVNAERPLLLHPATHDPRSHIGFREEIAYPIGNSARGRACIDILGLNHEEIVESRRGLLILLVTLKIYRQELMAEIERQCAIGVVADDLTAKLSKIDQELLARVHSDAEYSSMIKAALEGQL